MSWTIWYVTWTCSREADNGSNRRARACYKSELDQKRANLMLFRRCDRYSRRLRSCASTCSYFRRYSCTAWLLRRLRLCIRVHWLGLGLRILHRGSRIFRQFNRWLYCAGCRSLLLLRRRSLLRRSGVLRRRRRLLREQRLRCGTYQKQKASRHSGPFPIHFAP